MRTPQPPAVSATPSRPRESGLPLQTSPEDECRHGDEDQRADCGLEVARIERLDRQLQARTGDENHNRRRQPAVPLAAGLNRALGLPAGSPWKGGGRPGTRARGPLGRRLNGPRIGITRRGRRRRRRQSRRAGRGGRASLHGFRLAVAVGAPRLRLTAPCVERSARHSGDAGCRRGDGEEQRGEVAGHRRSPASASSYDHSLYRQAARLQALTLPHLAPMR